MQSLSIRLIGPALMLFFMVGCAQYPSSSTSGFTAPYSDPYTQSDFDELLGFGANMANTSATSRAETCKSLLKRQKDSTDPGIPLHLMMGRLLSDACGDIPKILDAVAAVHPHDERVQKLITIETEALKRMNVSAKKLGSLEHKQKSVQTVLEAKDSKGSKKDDARLLREKLEAIRSMEKQMDVSGEGN